MPNKIMWEKWIDPFLSNLDEVELPDIDSDEDWEYKDSFQRSEEGSRKVTKKNTGPVIVGPMGIIPLNEHNTPSKIYCFWMGHTNFDITKTIADKIVKVPGVEVMDIFTRYRFRMAIGKAFLSESDLFGRKVLDAVTEAVCAEPKIVIPKKNSDNNLNVLKEYLKKKYPYWVIYVLPNGVLDPHGSESKEELQKEVENSQLKRVATSWE